MTEESGIMSNASPKLRPGLLYRIPLVRRPFFQRDFVASQRDAAIAERDAAIAELDRLRSVIDVEKSRGSDRAAEIARIAEYISRDASVLQYRQAYFEAYGHTPPEPGVPAARPYPDPASSLSYKQKLTGLLPISNGRGAEIGPLDIPLLSKDEADILYVDHLDTEGLQKKYPTLTNIAPVDRPMVNNNLADTLRADSPLDYLVASQVMEHVPNPVRWLREAAETLHTGGLLALSLPDRRMTFDFLRHESRPSDVVSAYLNDAIVPDVRSVYDHHSQASLINMKWASELSVTPEEIVDGYGSVQPPLATDSHMEYVYGAKDGKYFDVHAWVFTPPSFLILMAQLTQEGFIPFRCRQFYPTDKHCSDRGNSSFTVILEKVSDDCSRRELRKSFLMCLGG
ncbi:methyltransferase domain-containing protein [Paraburkholderia sp. BR10954]|uniref:methyltransferase domain-containing protein n=1 Tax=Paraburkholderia sp. BR10954 TaxID=3236995 RepID=UPI0034D36418